MEPNEYKCAWCGEVFGLIRNDDWNQEKADEEYKRLFPNASMENRQVVCDDCWQKVRPDK